jgi:hypothetical protein
MRRLSALDRAKRAGVEDEVEKGEKEITPPDK